MTDEPSELEQAVALVALGFDLDKWYYISGPMTGYPNYNYERFKEVATWFREMGLKVHSPHENPWPDGHENMTESRLWGEMMKKCAIQMKKCSGIVMLQGWPQSRGAKSELKDAMNVNWPVWFLTDGNVLIGMNKVG